MPICSPSTLNCSIAAGRYTSQATNKGFFARLDFNKLASLPEKVVLPDPCKPDIKITEGFPFRLTSTLCPPINMASSSCTIFTNSCCGFNEVNTSCPMALSFTVSVNVLAIL